ncbi:MAG: cytochrome C [Acidobacteria bacterium]|nr:cytochrome C [Acidobacteriota bacterium]
MDKLLRVGIASSLMLAVIFVIGNNFLADRRPATLVPARDVETPFLQREAGMFQGGAPLPPADAEASTRTLAQFYSRRAYPGAPPAIPHPLFDKRSIGGRSCTGCHAKGGYVPVFKAYTPVTPHPEWSNCVSCHVSAAEKGRFVETGFIAAKPPPVWDPALPGGPPAVPHSLDNRSNCVACHAGPGAVKEIRTPHPERQNCRQCHVSLDDEGAFAR